MLNLVVPICKKIIQTNKVGEENIMQGWLSLEVTEKLLTLITGIKNVATNIYPSVIFYQKL